MPDLRVWDVPPNRGVPSSEEALDLSGGHPEVGVLRQDLQNLPRACSTVQLVRK